MEVAQPVQIVGLGCPATPAKEIWGRIRRCLRGLLRTNSATESLDLAKETLDLLPAAKRLRFPAPIELRFREDYFHRSIETCRFALGVGLFLYAAFGILDYWGIPSSRSYAWTIRYWLVCPFFAAVLGVSWLPIFQRIMQPALALVVIVAGLGIVAMIGAASVDEPAYSHYYAGLILVVMFGFNFVQLRLRYALVAATLTIAAYETVALLGERILDSPHGASLFLNSNFFFVSAHVLGISACYSLEFYKRRDFLQRRVIESDLIAAREVQHALIPDNFAAVPGLSIAGACRTSRQVGGDYLDVVPCGPGQWLFVIADVSGKGAAAALLMASLHAMIRTRAPGMTLQDIACLVNDHVHRFMKQGRYITAILASYEPSTRRLSYLNAGHSGGAVIGPGGDIRPMPSTGFPLGMFPQASWEVGEFNMPAGSMLLLYTDGVLDREDASGQCYGEQRLFRVARQPRGPTFQAVLNSILDDSDSFAAGTPMADDSTLLVAGVRGQPHPADDGTVVTSHGHIPDLIHPFLGLGRRPSQQQVLDNASDRGALVDNDQAGT